MYIRLHALLRYRLTTYLGSLAIGTKSFYVVSLTRTRAFRALFSLSGAAGEGFQNMKPKGAAVLIWILRKKIRILGYIIATWMVSCLWPEHQDTTIWFHAPVPIRIYCNCYKRYSHSSFSIYYSSWHFISKFFLC